MGAAAAGDSRDAGPFGPSHVWAQVQAVWQAPDRQFVQGLYLAIVFRPADRAGLAQWCGALSGGMSRADLVRALVRSEEARRCQTNLSWLSELDKLALAAPPRLPTPAPRGVSPRADAAGRRVGEAQGRGRESLRAAPGAAVEGGLVRVVIATTFLPFHEGGADKIVDDLGRELTRRGIQTDTVRLPLHPAWPAVPDQTLGLRLLDLAESSGERIDRLITVRTPAYALRHPNKVAWFIHHHREAYDLWGTRWGGMPDTDKGRRYRDMMRRSDDQYLRECRKVFTNSRIVADRLKKFNRLDADAVLYPPLPQDHSFRPGEFGDYFFYPSRITSIKRQELAIEAMKHARPGFRLVIAGQAQTDTEFDRLTERVRREGLVGRVEFTGWVSEERKAELMAGCCGVLYLAYLEDSYGYVTLEAFHSGKPVVTLTDSGGSLEVIEDGVNGLIAKPEPRALADAMNRLWADRDLTRRLGDDALRTPARHRIHWDHVIEKLTA